MSVEPSDLELIERVRQYRDRDALATLYDRYAGAIYSLALHVLREPRIAEDVVHDTFLTFWQRPETYVSGRGAFGPWILRVARNRSIDVLRRRRREQSSQATSDDQVTTIESRITDPDPDPSDQVWRREMAANVRAAMAELTAQQREVIELAYFRGMTQSEMANHLSIPLGTIKTRVRGALRRLNEIMTESSVWTDVQ